MRFFEKTLITSAYQLLKLIGIEEGGKSRYRWVLSVITQYYIANEAQGYILFSNIR